MMNTVLEDLEPMQTPTEDVLFSVGSAGLSRCRLSSLPTLYKVRQYLGHKFCTPPSPTSRRLGSKSSWGRLDQSSGLQLPQKNIKRSSFREPVFRLGPWLHPLLNPCLKVQCIAQSAVHSCTYLRTQIKEQLNQLPSATGERTGATQKSLQIHRIHANEEQSRYVKLI